MVISMVMMKLFIYDFLLFEYFCSINFIISKLLISILLEMGGMNRANIKDPYHKEK